jgi:hypothetical protein
MRTCFTWNIISVDRVQCTCMDTQTQIAEMIYATLPASPWIPAFWQRVQQHEPDDCWPWSGTINPVSGYGTLSRTVGGLGVTIYVHRIAWTLTHGLIPDGLTVDHVAARCGLRICCNPAHMELVTLAENGRRGNLTRWGTVGDAWQCRHGHTGERVLDRSGRPYCRACNRQKQARRRQLSAAASSSQRLE